MLHPQMTRRSTTVYVDLVPPLIWLSFCHFRAALNLAAVSSAPTLAMLPGSSLLLLLLAPLNLLPAGCCSHVMAGFDFETARPIPQVVNTHHPRCITFNVSPLTHQPRCITFGASPAVHHLRPITVGASPELWVPNPRFIELHDIILQIVREMLPPGARPAEPMRPQRMERIVKRGRETEGSWAPSGWPPAGWAPSGTLAPSSTLEPSSTLAPSGTLAPSWWTPSDQLKPFFTRGRVTRVGTSMNKEGLFERIFK